MIYKIIVIENQEKTQKIKNIKLKCPHGPVFFLVGKLKYFQSIPSAAKLHAGPQRLYGNVT